MVFDWKKELSFNDREVYKLTIQNNQGIIQGLISRLSYQKGFDGFVAFHSKTNLIPHYIKTLGAVHFGGLLMIINSESGEKLIEKYFKSLPL
jgi:hypothetical protein